MMLTLEEPYPHKTAFLQLGFRPFFTAALAFSALAMMAWSLFYLLGWSLPLTSYPTMTWHAHEMVFGYAMAVTAGFLLTAIRNWTNIPTVRGTPLLTLVLVWLAARVIPFSGLPQSLLLTAVFDLAFNLGLFAAALYPLVRAKQWVQAGIISKVLLIAIANLFFYLGLAGVIADGGRSGLYAGFYLILALIFTMGRRVIPFFIEKGVDSPFQARNERWIDISSLVLFLLFMIADITAPSHWLTATLAIAQFPIHALRLKYWYHADIWKKPLLWTLYVAYIWITLGFLFKAGAVWLGLSPFASVHSFAYGGIGLVTIGMIARVSLGHTGRNVFDPPRQLNLIFLPLAIGVIVRVLFPVIIPSMYVYWVGLAQILWIVAFTGIFVLYVPMLIKARVDGRPG